MGMTDQELEALLDDCESDRSERKESLSDSDKIRKTICAFANDMPNHQLPGVVFVGVEDDGKPAGFDITDKVLRTLADMRCDGAIMPFPTMVIQKRMLKGTAVAVVIVEPCDAPPVRVRGRTWIRVGPSLRLATPEEERRLTEKRRSRDLPFDISPVSAAKIAELDIDLFERVYLPSSVARDVLEQNRRNRNHQLASLRFITADGSDVPTVLGLLVVGKSPGDYIPGAYIQFLRVAGRELSDPIKDQKRITGPLTEVIQNLDAILKAHISTKTDIVSGPVEQQEPDYPIAALEQLTRNAILHRTYEGTNAPVRIYWFDDRIEIMNPGGPYGQVTRQNFGRPGVTDYRNRFLAEAMRNLGFVQQFGVGIQIAREALESNDNPPPEFVIEDTYMLVIVRRRT
jgi:ATP-dependent DNA helicase RecG